MDLIERQAAIAEVDSETVSTNPEHFKSSEKFIKFMDDADIASFGKWQWANGFNTALVATTIQLKKLPPAQPRKGEWIKISPANIYECSACGQNVMTNDIEAYRFCHGCGSKMKEENKN